MKKIITLLACTLVFSCSTAVRKQPAENKKTSLGVGKQVATEEQQKKALEIFTQILDLSQSENRAASAEERAGLYLQIITEYPDVPLAQESYWKLIELNLKDFVPPRKDRALFLYREFRAKYPDSPVREQVESAILRFFYGSSDWNGLIELERKSVEEFIKSGKLNAPGPMFYYSEAKLNLNDPGEAYKGYKIVVKFFPDSPEGKIARNRMSEIEDKIKTKSPEVK